MVFEDTKMDWKTLYCPNAHCEYYGIPFEEGKDEHIPFITSDQLPEYIDALLDTYGTLTQPERNGNRGRFPHPRLVPAQDLLYAQVVKVQENGRVIEVKTRNIFGKSEETAAQLTN
jgi:hypothetical protein